MAISCILQFSLFIDWTLPRVPGEVLSSGEESEPRYTSAHTCCGHMILVELTTTRTGLFLRTVFAVLLSYSWGLGLHPLDLVFLTAKDRVLAAARELTVFCRGGRTYMYVHKYMYT